MRGWVTCARQSCQLGLSGGYWVSLWSERKQGKDQAWVPPTCLAHSLCCHGYRLKHPRTGGRQNAFSRGSEGLMWVTYNVSLAGSPCPAASIRISRVKGGTQFTSHMDFYRKQILGTSLGDRMIGQLCHSLTFPLNMQPGEEEGPSPVCG